MWIHLLTLRLIDGAGTATVIPPVVVATPGGVHRARFLRRSKRTELPWEREETVVTNDGVVVKAKRRRIPLPAVQKIEKEIGLPIEAVRDIPAFSIKVPELGTATIDILEDEQEDDLVLWMM